MFPLSLSPEGHGTQESAVTESICARLQSKMSSGIVGGQLAGEKAHGKTCLIRLRLDSSENRQEPRRY